MEEDFWLLYERDGRFHQARSPKGKRPHNPKRLRAVKVERHTDDPHCERYDEATGEWVLDAAKRAAIDEEVRIVMLSGADVYRELMPRIIALTAEVEALKEKIK